MKTVRLVQQGKQRPQPSAVALELEGPPSRALPGPKLVAKVQHLELKLAALAAPARKLPTFPP